MQCNVLVLCYIQYIQQAGKHTWLILGFSVLTLSWNHETHFSFTKKERVSHSTASVTTIANITHTHSHVHTSHPSKCHRLSRTLHRCQRFGGPGINITSFLSIRAYLFPSSYCTSASDPICIPGKSPDKSRPWREGKTKWDKDEERGEKRMREKWR